MDKTRKIRLRKLIDGPPYNGNQAKFNDAMGWSSGRVSQLLSADEPFGERAAKNIQERLGLAPGFFELPETGLLAAEPNPPAMPSVPISQLEQPLSPMGESLGKLFDQIPESDVVRRSIAYGQASNAILSVLLKKPPTDSESFGQ